MRSFTYEKNVWMEYGVKLATTGCSIRLAPSTCKKKGVAIS